MSGDADELLPHRRFKCKSCNRRRCQEACASVVMRRRSRLVAVSLALAVVVAGCGGASTASADAAELMDAVGGVDFSLDDALSEAEAVEDFERARQAGYRTTVAAKQLVQEAMRRGWFGLSADIIRASKEAAAATGGATGGKVDLTGIVHQTSSHMKREMQALQDLLNENSKLFSEG